MSNATHLPPAETDRGAAWRGGLSTAALTLTLLLLAATFLLISPVSGASFPGQIPWREGSLLRRLCDAMSLYGLFETARGVEIKDVAFHVASAAGLVLLALRAWVSARYPVPRPPFRGAWFFAQCFLAAWVVLSLASAAWAGDPALALSQGALYALALAWAVSLAWTLEIRDVPRLLAGYVAIAAIAAGLCVWYYTERNPHHRPGFPIGNPSPLAACILPAVVICGCVLAREIIGVIRRREAGPLWVTFGAALALVPLLGCFRLTDSRAALLALAGSVGAIVFVLLRSRWRAAFLLLLLGLAAFAIYRWQGAASDLAMARGASLRFRMYAWRYAAELWAMRTVTGHGAGAYPRLGGSLAVQDRQLDPAAFMGSVVEHAHNELFEVFAEIGLLGGVTFVAGYLATAVACLAVLLGNHSRQRWWLLAGLMGGLAGLVIDALFGVGLRLPGVPAVFYTLLGAAWSLGRATSGAAVVPPASAGSRTRDTTIYRYVTAGLALVGALVAAGLTWRNLVGLRFEALAERAAIGGDNHSAMVSSAEASDLLLEPFRRLAAAQRQLEAASGVAAESAGRALRTADGGAAPPATGTAQGTGDRGWQHAVQNVERVHAVALEFEQAAPAFDRATLIAARAAELLARLYASVDATKAREWSAEAWRAWLRRYQVRPTDVETLIALTGYPGSDGDRVVLLRDALRAGFPPVEWVAALRRAAAQPGFAAALEAQMAAVGPYDPRTDLDTLILSRAPEIHRLHAAVRALGGDFAEAERDAARAADMYRPMTPRFPHLRAVALAEEGEYAFRAAPGRPERAIELAQQALAALPPIQAQQFDELARPFRLRLARYLLAADRTAEAEQVVAALADDATQRSRVLAGLYLELVAAAARLPGDHRPDVGAWAAAALRLAPRSLDAWSWKAWLAAQADGAAGFTAVLHAAAAAGLGVDDLVVIRQRVCNDWPRACE